MFVGLEVCSLGNTYIDSCVPVYQEKDPRPDEGQTNTKRSICRPRSVGQLAYDTLLTTTMVQGPSRELIDAIRRPASSAAQVAALRQIKNEIVGHEQRKEIAVKQGVVEPLLSILANRYESNDGKYTGNTDEARDAAHCKQVEDAVLQALLILGSLASGGVTLVKPVMAAGAHQCLFELLNAETMPRLIMAALKALRNICRFEAQVDGYQFHIPVAVLERLLKHSAKNEQITIVADIVALYANRERRKSELAKGEVLNLLTLYLICHTTAQYHPGGVSTIKLASALFNGTPSQATITAALFAISAIITGSNYRAQCFINNPSLQQLLEERVLPPGALFCEQTGMPGSMASLLPSLHIPAPKTVSYNSGSSAFPALNTFHSNERQTTSGQTHSQPREPWHVNHANEVVSWLTFLARSTQGSDRLAALKMLALVNTAIDSNNFITRLHREQNLRSRERDRRLSMLAVPLAVGLITRQAHDRAVESTSSAAELDQRIVKEQACEVLALLIQGSKELQSAAVDAGAIKHVCPILKNSFEKVPMVRPLRFKKESVVEADMPSSCILGPSGLPEEVQHALRCRQSSLEALAALAKQEDTHRKAIVEAQVVPCIIDSLKPLSLEFMHSTSAKAPQHFTSKDGNSVPVILAACHAARSMSRSVSLLRTSLIDAGIARPVFQLLKHSNVQVQIAATDACCNLLLDFSPMREDLLAAGVIKTLTEHARQVETGLRLASLWALKHLILAASRDIKMQCLKELGTGWLVGAIQGEPKESGGGVSVGLGGPNAAGEQVDLLNPSMATNMDVDVPAVAGNEEDDVEDDDNDDQDEDGAIMYDEAAQTHYQSSQLRSTLQPSFDRRKYLNAFQHFEQNPVLQAKRDDIAVQEQALDFVRNLLNGDDCAFMIDHVLKQLGQDKVFALLTEKLLPVPPSFYSVRQLVHSSNGPAYHPTALILSSIHVLNHIANGSPVHKSLLIAQKQLLAAWLPHFSHHDRRVRVICVWAVNSLTWVEDDADREGARRRATELRSVGIEAKVRELKDDPDLDTRERVKTALRQLEGL